MELAQLVLGLDEREPAVEVDLLRLGRHVVGRDVGVDLRVDPHGPGDGAARARELGHRLAEQLDVELEPDCRDVARLLGPEEVAGAADLEVAHRDREAAPSSVWSASVARRARASGVSSCPSG